MMTLAMIPCEESQLRTRKGEDEERSTSVWTFIVSHHRGGDPMEQSGRYLLN